MTNTKEIIEQLKEIKSQRGLSLDTIYKMMEDSGYTISKTTLSRLFGKGSEELGFNYDLTIRPLANVLLGVDHVEEDDIADIKAMKFLLQDKRTRINDLEKQLVEEKEKHHEKLEKERKAHTKEIDDWKHQIELKDGRIDKLLDSNLEKDKLINSLLVKCDNCEFHHK